jgi:hypothetical protein
VNALPEFPEIPFQGVSRAFFYHAQKKKDKFFEGHFSLPGEIFGSPAGPPSKPQALYKIFDRLIGRAF